MEADISRVTDDATWADTGRRRSPARRAASVRPSIGAGPLPDRCAGARRPRRTAARAAWSSIGDADFATNLHLGVLGNRDLLLLAAEVAARGDQALTASRQRPGTSGPFSTLALTAREARSIFWDGVRRAGDVAGDRRARRRAASEADARDACAGRSACSAWPLALLVVVWLERAPIVPERPLPTPETPALLDAPTASVSRLEWQRDADRLILVRTPAGWHDASGHPWPADVVDVALDALASLHPHPVLSEEPID